MIEWIDAHCSERFEEPAFIRELTTAVVESCIDDIGQSVLSHNIVAKSFISGGPTSQCKLNEGLLKARGPILKRYMDAKVQLEGQALVAMQYLMHK